MAPAVVLMASACGSADDAVAEALPDRTGAPPTAQGLAEACSPDGASGLASSITDVLESGGNSYSYLLYVPGGTSAPIPLVLNFHGLGGNGRDQARYSEYQTLAASEGFAAVHPSGLAGRDSGGVRNWEESRVGSPARDDVQFVSDLIDRVAAQACIDLSRVYATGFSNGGYFSAHLVCELADRIAAAVSVAGISHPDDCDPSRPVALAAIHGTADDIVPFDGSGESLLLGDGKTSSGISAEKAAQLRDAFSQVMPDELAEFAADFNCAAWQDTRIGDETTLTRYTGCDGSVELRFYAVAGGGHTWPSSRLAVAYNAYGQYATTDISATADGWAFMSQYSLDD